MSYDYTADKLVQETTANYFHNKLGWESVYAYNDGYVVILSKV